MRIVPLISVNKGSFSSFVSKLERPYLEISKEQCEDIINITENGINGKPTDFIFMDNRACTFGDADGGYAIMPLQKQYSDKIIDRFLKYCDSEGIDGLSILNNSPTRKNILQDVPDVKNVSNDMNGPDMNTEELSMNTEKLQLKNEAQAELVHAQMGNIEYIDIPSSWNNMFLWKNELDVKDQLDYLARNATFMGTTISQMISHSENNHGMELISSYPRDIPQKDIKPLFLALNSFQHYIEDTLIDFFEKNNMVKDESELYDKIDNILSKIILASNSHDSHWGIGIAGEQFSYIVGDFENMKEYILYIFDWKDFAIKLGESKTYIGEELYSINGKTVDTGSITESDLSGELFSMLSKYVRKLNSPKRDIENNMDSNIIMSSSDMKEENSEDSLLNLRL